MNRTIVSIALVVSCASLAQTAGEITVPRLSYNKGHVISNVKVVPVFWGPNLFTEAKLRIGPFYEALVVSPFFDFLNEYATTVPGGTQQTINPGTTVPPVTITPINQNTLLNELDLQTEVAAQIAANGLPTPDSDTIYMLHFPAGIGLMNGKGSYDCSVPNGSFCGYHANGKSGATTFRFAAMPDVSQGLCATGCLAPTGSVFDNLTATSSHELFEAITDPDDGTGWYDKQPQDAISYHQEIGDICSYVYDDTMTIAGTGGPFIVQREWSNLYSGCIVSKNDAYTVDLSVPKPTVAPGSDVSLTVTLGQPAQLPDQTAAVHVKGVPSGQAINPVPFPINLKTGQTSQLTIHVGANVTPGAYQLEVIVAGARATIFKALPLVVQKDNLLVSLDPSDLTVNDGATAQVNVQTTNAGNAKMVALSATGLPDGVTATFDPAMLNAGDASVMTLTVPKGTAGVSMQTITVVATAASPSTLSATADATLTIHAGGCSTAAGGVSWLAALALLGLVRRRS
jgi:hypothetical protein